MLINVIDLEATCWEPQSTRPPGEKQEIIEIGICTLNLHSMQIDDQMALFCKPQFSSLSAFCTKLTTITPEMLENAPSFPWALEYLVRTYKANSRVWCSWGDFDRKCFEATCDLFEVEFPFGPHRNVATMAREYLGTRRDKRLGMAGTLGRFGLKMYGTHHRGVDDAVNIARIDRKSVV